MTQTAKIYGSGLYDLAMEDGLVDVLMQQLLEVRTLFRESPDYVKLLSEPSIPKAERVSLIDAAFGAQVERYLINFMKLLCEHNLMGEFAGCCEEYTRRYNVDHNITEATVYSAIALTEAQAETLKKRLEALTGKTVMLDQKTDASVVAGLRVEIDGKQFDGTLKGRMDGLSKKLDEMIV
jgi:F-type H+-transporting ATPase subunit delta